MFLLSFYFGTFPILASYFPHMRNALTSGYHEITKSLNRKLYYGRTSIRVFKVDVRLII